MLRKHRIMRPISAFTTMIGYKLTCKAYTDVVVHGKGRRGVRVFYHMGADNDRTVVVHIRTNKRWREISKMLKVMEEYYGVPVIE